jgi:hypothetical protein
MKCNASYPIIVARLSQITITTTAGVMIRIPTQDTHKGLHAQTRPNNPRWLCPTIAQFCRANQTPNEYPCVQYCWNYCGQWEGCLPSPRPEQQTANHGTWEGRNKYAPPNYCTTHRQSTNKGLFVKFCIVCIVAKRDTLHNVFMTSQRPNDFTGWQVPQHDGLFPTAIPATPPNCDNQEDIDAPDHWSMMRARSDRNSRRLYAPSPRDQSTSLCRTWTRTLNTALPTRL